jgi:hypothetical protein
MAKVKSSTGEKRGVPKMQFASKDSQREEEQP